jgi:predicted DNA-binding transcriptional regulator AlpA
MKKKMRPRVISVDKAAKYLGISPKTIRNRLGPKAKNPFPLKPKHIGKRVLFDVIALDSYINSLPAG